MAKIIILRYPGKCADCGTRLPKGTRALWHGNGVMYGLHCCSADDDRKFENGFPEEGEPLGLTYSSYDEHGVYSSDGHKFGSTCGYEDYPCCGH